jgi:hypothetical protein
VTTAGSHRKDIISAGLADFSGNKAATSVATFGPLSKILATEAGIKAITMMLTMNCFF